MNFRQGNDVFMQYPSIVAGGPALAETMPKR
jgi:hypothetical protein